MPSLLLTIFLMQLLIHLINTIGASTINELLWTLYTRLPTQPAQSQREQNRLRAEVVRLKRDMAATSAQDNFARWAKIRREHDRALQGHDDIAAKNSSSKSKFNTYASTGRWLSTNGLRLFLQFWHARTAVFKLPRAEGGTGWAPAWVEWVVGFPRVKERGGVSVQVWGWACVIVIGLVGDAVAWGLEWVVRSRGTGGEKTVKNEPMKMGTETERTKSQ